MTEHTICHLCNLASHKILAGTDPGYQKAREQNLMASPKEAQALTRE